MNRTVLDFETRSAADLKKTGAYRYSLDPSTRVTCAAIKPRDGELFVLPFTAFSPEFPFKKLPGEIQSKWGYIARNHLIVAHNAFFEHCIYDNVLVAKLGWPKIRDGQWRCTAAKAAACALPRSLAGAGEALKLSVQKDKGGMIAMMRTCRPSKEWNAWKKKREKLLHKFEGEPYEEWRVQEEIGSEPEMFISPESHPQVFKELYHYCGVDSLTEEKLDQVVPDLPPSELRIWQLNQTMNWRGFGIDLPLVQKILTIMEGESKRNLRKLDETTWGLVQKPGARAAILEFLAMEGIELPDIRANTVQDTLEGKHGKLSKVGKQLLELRKVLSKTSTKKYQGFVNRVSHGDRIRDISLYHGASTGRDSGTGIQIQNFPRPVIPIDKARPYAPAENARECDEGTLQLLYGENLSLLFSSILRNMIIATPGYELFVADFSKIEVAVGWWIAGNRPGVRILKAGGDPYKRLAAMNTGKQYEDIDDESFERQLAKRQILGCMYGMGWEKFQRTAWEVDRLELSDVQSKHAVKQYRETFPDVTRFWRTIERAAIQAVRTPNRRVVFPHGSFIVENHYLWMVLPSGRRIAYRDPQLVTRISQYTGEEQETLEFWAVNSRTKKWGLERIWGGVLYENMVQGVARDLLVNGFPKLEKTGYHVLFTVHDETVAERKKGKGSMEEFISIMCQRPDWVDDNLVLEAKGYSNVRYRK